VQEYNPNLFAENANEYTLTAHLRVNHNVLVDAQLAGAAVFFFTTIIFIGANLRRRRAIRVHPLRGEVVIYQIENRWFDEFQQGGQVPPPVAEQPAKELWRRALPSRNSTTFKSFDFVQPPDLAILRLESLHLTTHKRRTASQNGSAYITLQMTDQGQPLNDYLVEKDRPQLFFRRLDRGQVYYIALSPTKAPSVREVLQAGIHEVKK
jgi:hypothetical protein